MEILKLKTLIDKYGYGINYYEVSGAENARIKLNSLLIGLKGEIGGSFGYAVTLN